MHKSVKVIQQVYKTTNMALFRGSRAVGKALAAAVDSGIVAPSALYHKNVRYMGILRIMIRNVLF